MDFPFHVPSLTDDPVTIYSDEGLHLFENLVPLQVKFTGHGVIPSSLADVPCACLGVEGLLAKLNELMQTSYDLHVPGMRDVLAGCIERDEDFGLAYGLLRHWWFLSGRWDWNADKWIAQPQREDFRTMQDDLQQFKSRDRKAREDVMDRKRGLLLTEKLGRPPPRRIWDLFSNRILERWVVAPPGAGQFEYTNLYAVSHSWMDAAKRQDVDTPINGHKWLVPIPDDTTLERVRVELLNLGAQYAWLDVLCLRQEPGHAEWELDVPCIGSTYQTARCHRIVHYFSGLGRPFHVGDLSSPRHWVNRAWTLQEFGVPAKNITAGIAADSPVAPNPIDLAQLDKVVFTDAAFRDALAAIRAVPTVQKIVFHAVSAMAARAAECELDKVAGLAYVLQARATPMYIRGEDLESAWTRLVDCMGVQYWAHMLFLYPVPGNGRDVWRPTWRQLMEGIAEGLPVRLSGSTAVLNNSSWPYDASKGYWTRQIYVRVFENCRIEGLGRQPSAAWGSQGRTGTVYVQDKSAKPCLSFPVLALHDFEISETPCVLLGCTILDKEMWGKLYRRGAASSGCEYLVVGYFADAGKFVKVSVIESSFVSVEAKEAFLQSGAGEERWVDLV